MAFDLVLCGAWNDGRITAERQWQREIFPDSRDWLKRLLHCSGLSLHIIRFISPLGSVFVRPRGTRANIGGYCPSSLKVSRALNSWITSLNPVFNRHDRTYRGA
jgi:hypothetical protein